MKARHRRFIWIALGMCVIGVAVTLVLRAFNSNLVFFFTPTQVAENQAPVDRTFRIGGTWVTNFGSDDVDKFTRFAVAASFNDGG